MTKNANPFSISVTNLSKRFNREWILKNFTYRFQSGTTYAITGPNGSGKSTLLQILWGQVPPSSGELIYSKGTSTVLYDDVFAHISVATPYMDLIEELTLQEHIDFHFKMKKLRDGFSPADIINVMYLDEARHKYISNFSSGMKQRLKLGLAFYTEADVLFLDEPGSHLDDRAFGWYLEQLKSSTFGLTFIGSNDPAEYPATAEKLYLPDLRK